MLLLADFETTVDSCRDADVRTKLEAYYKNQEGPLEPIKFSCATPSKPVRGAIIRPSSDIIAKCSTCSVPNGTLRERFRGSTGTPQSDQKLEKMLASLLAGGQSDAGDEGN